MRVDMHNWMWESHVYKLENMNNYFTHVTVGIFKSNLHPKKRFESMLHLSIHLVM